VAEVKNLTRVKRSLGEDQDLADVVANVVANVSDILDADLVANLTDAVANTSSIENKHMKFTSLFGVLSDLATAILDVAVVRNSSMDHDRDHDHRLDQIPSIPIFDMDSTHLEKFALGSVAAAGAFLFLILLYCVLKCIWKRWPITSTAESSQSSSPSVSEISESDIEAAAEQSQSSSPSAPEYDDERHNEEVWFTIASEAPELTEQQEPLNEQTMTNFEKNMMSASKDHESKEGPTVYPVLVRRTKMYPNWLRSVQPEQSRTPVVEVQHAWMFDDEVIACLAARNEALLIGIKLSICRSHVRALERIKAEREQIASSGQMSSDKAHVLNEELLKVWNQLASDMKELKELEARFGATDDEKAQIAELAAISWHLYYVPRKS
jgi:hypothetical protein